MLYSPAVSGLYMILRHIFCRFEKKCYFCENLEIMAKALAEQLARLGHKSELLVTRFATLRRRNEELVQELEELRATLRARDAQIERLQLEREHLRVSAAVAATPEDVRRARTLVSELVRDIDLCIADLTRDI